MHSRATAKKAAPRTRAAQKVAPKRAVPNQKKKRQFSTLAPTNDPRFSTINADVDRAFQAYNTPQPRLAKFDNGFSVASQEAPGGLTTIALTVEAGSRYEDDTNNGVAKVVANALFHGNDTMNRTQFTAAFEAMGGSFSAKVGRERTVIKATVHNQFTPQAIKLLGTVFKKPKLTAEVVDAEKQAAIAHLDDLQSDLQTAVDDRLHQAAYRYSTLSLSPSGHVSTLKDLTAAQAQTFHNTHYIAPRTVLSIVGGGIDHLALAEVAHDAFAHLPSEATNGIHAKKTPANFFGSDIRVRDDDMPRVHYSFGFSTAGYNDADSFALMALGHIIGNTNALETASEQYHSSEFVQSVAINGVANSTTIFNHQYSDHGVFGMYAVASPMALDVLSEFMIRGLVRHATHVPEQAVIEARSKMKAELLAFQGTEAVAEDIGRQIIQHKRVISSSEIAERIDAIDQTAVQNVVKRFIVDQDFVISAMGNTFELQDYAVLRKKSYLPFM